MAQNMDNIIEKTHNLHQTHFARIDKYWSELQRQPKWKLLQQIGGIKRTKLGDSGIFSSSTNDEHHMPIKLWKSRFILKVKKHPKGKKKEKKKVLDVNVKRNEEMASV